MPLGRCSLPRCGILLCSSLPVVFPSALPHPAVFPRVREAPVSSTHHVVSRKASVHNVPFYSSILFSHLLSNSTSSLYF